MSEIRRSHQTHELNQPNIQLKFQPEIQSNMSENHKLITLNNLNTDGKVQNPLTGIYIYADGRLATKLRKEGILDPSTAPPEEYKRSFGTNNNTHTHANTHPRVTSKNTTFVVNKITREDALEQPHDPEINQRLNQSQHNHYHINFQSKSNRPN